MTATRPCQSDFLTRSRGAFTLLELLVVVAIIGVLISILLPALSHARKCAIVTGELSAARSFIAAHRMYSGDYRGTVLPGYPSSSMVRRGDVSARNFAGDSLSGLPAQRYPWRLMPYLGNELGVFYRDASKIEDLFQPGAEFDYAVSAAPRMGLNQAFVGGSGEQHAGTGYAFVDSERVRRGVEQSFGKRWYVRREADVGNASKLIVFASSYGTDPINGTQLDGSFHVQPPSFTDRIWSLDSPNESSRPAETGFVAFRFLGKSVASMFDGHAETLSWEEMQDMRRWAPRAKSEDYSLPGI